MRRRKLKVYIDTSVISAMFDMRNPERRFLTRNFWNHLREMDPYVSDVVYAEVVATPDAPSRSGTFGIKPG